MSWFGTISPEAALEIDSLLNENDKLCAKPVLTRSDKTRIDANLAKISALKKAGLTTDEYRRAKADQIGGMLAAETRKFQDAHESVFRGFLSGKEDADLAYETRTANDLLAGIGTIAFTAGPQGGVLVPQQFQQSVTLGMAATDPLLNPDVCEVIQEKSFILKPLQIPGWDLSTISATKVNEAAQHASDVVPSADQKLLNKYTYRLSLGASLEFEQDQRAFARLMGGMGMAMGIGFARGIGADLVNGDGATGPSGILNGLSSAFTTANSGKIVVEDINNAFYAVNPIYRASEKCGWLMNDAAHKLVANSKDDQNLPLIKVSKGVETLCGKPVYISPSLPTSGAGSFCVFGALDYFKVHVSAMWLRRSLQVPGYVENGKALFTGLMMADAVLFDPTGGSLPPVVAATLHS